MPNLQCKPDLAIIACDNLALRGSVRAACPQAPKGLRSTYGTFIHPRKHPLSGLFLRNRGQPTILRRRRASRPQQAAISRQLEFAVEIGYFTDF